MSLSTYLAYHAPDRGLGVIEIVVSLVLVAGFARGMWVLPRLWRNEYEWAWDRRNAPAPDAYARVTPASTVLAGLTPPALLLVGLAGDTGALHALLDVALVAWFVCFCVAMSIVFFNRPKWAVPPHLREQPGAVATWWRRLRTRTTR